MVHKKLHDWYAKNGRKDLPWRNTDDPYHIYISEVMLQQTQVKTVLERYYFQFLEKFPSLEVLSLADLDEVLKMWEGLGYYTRAKNLHKTAQIIQPKLPKTYEALLKLPGIGKNTASAICAFAYKQNLAVMEANVKRILCRIHVLKNPKEEELRDLALEMLDRENPYDYNQAIMDIGAMICKVKNPICKECPFSIICKSYEENNFLYPEKKRKILPTKTVDIVVRHHNEKLYLKQREGRFLHGLWGFEEVDEVLDDAVYVMDVEQRYTHFKLEAKVYLLEVEDYYDIYLSLDKIDQVALSSVDKKILAYLLTQEIL